MLVRGKNWCSWYPFSTMKLIESRRSETPPHQPRTPRDGLNPRIVHGTNSRYCIIANVSRNYADIQRPFSTSRDFPSHGPGG